MSTTPPSTPHNCLRFAKFLVSHESHPPNNTSHHAGEYGLACEHAHSCCILLARVDKFKVGGAWHTWIDYDRFQQLAAEGESRRGAGGGGGRGEMGLGMATG